MNVPLKDFYIEVTGMARSNEKMMADLNAWGIPTTLRGTGNGSRKHYGVDIAALGEAKAKWELEKERAVKPQRATSSALGQALKQEERHTELMNHIRGLEVALNALLKMAKS